MSLWVDATWCTNIAWYWYGWTKHELLESLEKYESTNFICIGTCNVLSANNAFGEGMATLREVVNLGQLLIDLNFFFNPFMTETVII